MQTYEDSLTLRAARDLYFFRSGFDAKSYTDRWVIFKFFGIISLYFPNVPARKRAVKLHDLHHVLTGYDSTWLGEAEISAWEVAAGGSGRHPMVWFFKIIAIAIGLILNPNAVRFAYLRGKNSRNLFDREFDESLLEETVGSMRLKLQIT